MQILLNCQMVHIRKNNPYFFADCVVCKKKVLHRAARL